MDTHQSYAIPSRSASGLSFPNRIEKPKRDQVTVDGRSFTNSRSTKPPRFSRHALPARPTFLPTDNGGLSWQFTKNNVTCFYWARGGCKKSEVNCHYAHFLTTIVADSPMAFGHVSERKAPSGKAGQAIIKDTTARHNELRDQETRFAERQMALNGEVAVLARRVKEQDARQQELELKAYELDVRELELEALEKELERRAQELDKGKKALEKREKALAGL
ncbi:hypothetical protein B0A48_01962 [Cryoendolithus antarcticus]|uniref:C3H1-type domain-containing protein n=1 Tax=Cryoendolithus antarcticus TaxID=1507870 RepID=A0A1V8TR87_9PEZI|nr:hypothetical protein B0A48_01962 [Cryoendolithus antarcticus]